MVSLLPDQILEDLSIDFETISRKVSSFTPAKRNGVDVGLMVNRQLDTETKDSFVALTGNDGEYKAWDSFYSDLYELAQVMAPTMLKPLLTKEEMKKIALDNGLSDIWDAIMERPLSEVIESTFADDLVQGVVLTDGLIGTFTPSNHMMANICFLYHLIGNGTGEWKVPVGGMGAFVKKLTARATELGVEIRTDAKVVKIANNATGKTIDIESGEVFHSEFIAANCAPQVLAKILGTPAPKYVKGSQL